MHLYAVLTFGSDHKLEHSQYNLDEFFSIFRSKIRTEIETIASTIITRCTTNTTYVIDEKVHNTELIIYGSTYSKYNIVITNQAYPSFTAKQLLYEMNQGKKPIEKLFSDYQVPANIDKIHQLKTELDDTKIIILKSLDDLIARGSDLDDLLERAKQLEYDSQILVDDTKKMNRCCVIF